MAQPPTKQPYVMPKINFVVRLQHWMDSVPGQTFLNYAYSWGAAIVILGALFKLTHLPGGNLMLFLGMGTEVVVFFLSAFDRPFDKNEVGRELAQDYETDDEIAKRLGLSDDDETTDEDDPELVGDEDTTETAGTTSEPAPAATGGGQAIIFAGGMGQPSGQAPTPEPAAPAEAAAAAINVMTPAGSQPFASEAERLAAIIRMANDELLHRAQAVLSPDMEEATKTYIEKLQTLADTFTKVDEQSARLAKDSEEMENLNRTLTGINKVYELHLKGISLQVGTIDQINEQTHKLANQIEELNAVYGRMIEALTVNMRGNAPTGGNTAS